MSAKQAIRPREEILSLDELHAILARYRADDDSWHMWLGKSAARDQSESRGGEGQHMSGLKRGKVTAADITSAHAAFWNEESKQLEQLRQRYPDARAHRILEAARVIADAFTLETGNTSYAAAVRAAEALDGLSKRIYAAGRQRANLRSKAMADQATLMKFRAWEKRHQRSVQGLDCAARVKTYTETAELSDREARRIRRLLKEEKIFSCTGVNGRDCESEIP